MSTHVKWTSIIVTSLLLFYTSYPRFCTAQDRDGISLPVTTIQYGDPCNYQIFTEFFTEIIKIEGKKIFDALFNRKYDPGNNAPEIEFKDLLKELCIEVDADHVVDIYKFDCLPPVNDDKLNKGTCNCSRSMGMVDPLININNNKIPSGQLRSYNAVLELERNLKLENGECVSGKGGHCTLANTNISKAFLEDRKKHEMKCSAEKFTGDHNHKLVCLESLDKNLVNKMTQELYGTCQIQDTDVDLPHRGKAQQLNVGRWNTCRIFFVAILNLIFVNKFI